VGDLNGLNGHGPLPFRFTIDARPV
jgi:hypothetical protein